MVLHTRAESKRHNMRHKVDTVKPLTTVPHHNHHGYRVHIIGKSHSIHPATDAREIMGTVLRLLLLLVLYCARHPFSSNLYRIPFFLVHHQHTTGRWTHSSSVYILWYMVYASASPVLWSQIVYMYT